MNNIVDIKRRIKSVDNIYLTTKAIKLISTAKMRQANQNYLNNVRYFNKVRKTIKDILDHKGEIEHKYLQHRETNRAAFVVIASDTSMAGDYNLRVLKQASKIINEYLGSKTIYTIGTVATNYFVNQGLKPEIDFLTIAKNFRLRHARNIAFHLMDQYDKNRIDEINIIYTIHQEGSENKVIFLRLLPILTEDFSDIIDSDHSNTYQFEPSVKEVFNILATEYIIGLTYSAMVQSIKCEHEERMEAMNNASNSASEMLSELKLNFHRARQEQITNELIELSSEGSHE